MTEGIDFENHQILHLKGKRLSFESRDGHVLRGRRDIVGDGDSPCVDLSIDTSRLTLRYFVVEK